MPRGVKGSGPYSKYKSVQNDLAVGLKDEPATEKTAPAKKAAAKKAPAKRSTAARKAPAKRTPAPVAASTNGSNGNGRASVLTATAISVQPDGTISFIGDGGTIQKIQVEPTYLLTLESRVKKATDEFVKNLAASRS